VEAHDKAMAKQATVFLVVAMVFGVLLALDLMNKGLVWRTMHAFRSDPNNTLPNERRTVGEAHKTDVQFLS
jgi:hypothetical protein